METYTANLRAQSESAPSTVTDTTPPVQVETAAPFTVTKSFVPSNGADLTLPDHSLTQEELSKRILGFVVEKQSYGRLKPQIPSTVPADEIEFVRTFIEDVEFDTRVYSLQGHKARVLVPEEYAQKLDIVRQRRLGQIDLLPEELIGYLNRVLPEDVLVVLDELPNSDYISDISLVDWRNTRDVWVRATRNTNTFVSTASTMPDGQVVMYCFDAADKLRETLFHEWNHNLHTKHMPLVKEVWESVVNMEWFVFVPDSYALVNFGEHWAVFGEAIVQKDGTRYAEIVNGLGPMRALVWTTALGKALKAVPADQRGCYHDIWLKRVAYASKHGLELARARAAKMLSDAQRADDFFKTKTTRHARRTTKRSKGSTANG